MDTKNTKNVISNCCKNGSEAIHYFQNRKEYCLRYEGEEWWIIICYCPWCGKKLDKLPMYDDKTLEMDKF